MNESLARILISAATEKATDIGINVCIAVIDEGSLLKAFHHMDDAFKGSIDVAIAKARTSALFPFPTGDLGELIRTENLTGIELTNQGLAVFPGGLPIFNGKDQIGAIGISGGSAQQDDEVASFAITKANLLDQST